MVPARLPRIRVWALAGCLIAGLALVLTLVAGGHAARRSVHRDPDYAAAPLDLRRTSVDQSRSRLRLRVRTAGKWSLRQLQAATRPDDADPHSYLCFELSQRRKQWRYCMTQTDDGPAAVGGRLNDRGELRYREHLSGAHIFRSDDSSVAVRFPYASAHLRVGRYGWRARSDWSKGSCAPPIPPVELPRRRAARAATPDCADRAPNQGFYRTKVRRPQMVGCTRDEDRVSTNGSRRSNKIALTFDDGPSAYTSRVIEILNRFHVRGTFFVIGGNVPGRAALLKKMIKGRHEIGNHSLYHESTPSAGSIHETSQRIKAASGFTPCTYRPPGGSRASGPIAAAWAQGMSSILWDVDTRDWDGPPGAGTIYSRAVSARSGSIVLMHDGGGNRSGTVAALDDIIRTLKHRGYDLVTVTQLLHERFRWRP